MARKNSNNNNKKKIHVINYKGDYCYCWQLKKVTQSERSSNDRSPAQRQPSSPAPNRTSGWSALRNVRAGTLGTGNKTRQFPTVLTSHFVGCLCRTWKLLRRVLIMFWYYSTLPNGILLCLFHIKHCFRIVVKWL